jgi:hypothetical protein
VAVWKKITLLCITIQGKKKSTLSDEKRLWDFALLCDISHHLNYLYTKIQGPQSSFITSLGLSRDCLMKLKLFWKLYENVNLCHFSSCGLLGKDGSVSVPIQSVHTVKVTDSWANNFKMKFSICSRTTNIHSFEISFCFVESWCSRKIATRIE